MDLVPIVDGKVVLLPPHEDEFGRPGQHYHQDFRYTEFVGWHGDTVFSDAEPTWEPREQIRESYGPLIGVRTHSLVAVLAQEFDRVRADGTCAHKGLPLMAVGPGGEAVRGPRLVL